MNTLKLVGIRGGGRICAVSALMLSCAWAARASVFDDAKFKLDLRGGDPNGNAFVDSGEIVNAYNSAQTAVLGGGQGASKITAAQYKSGGYDSYGELPYVSAVPVVNPATGATYTQNCLILPQSKKTVDGSAYWSENGIVFNQGRVMPGKEGYITLYVRFKWEGHSGGNLNFLVGNGWDGSYSNLDNGVSVYIASDGTIGLLGGNGMPSSDLKVSENVWHDLFVSVRNEDFNGTEKAVAQMALYKANAGAAPTTTAASLTKNNAMLYSSSKTRVPFGCILTANGWVKKTNPRAFKGQIANAMIWDRALTDDEMTEVMTGSAPCGGEWQIGAVNGSANEFNDTTPADVYDVQTMPWNKMRKSLTADNPSLTLSTTMTADDHKRNRTLTFTPILSGAASAPVEISLNGTVVGEIDLATTTSITLPRKLWRHGSGLANTIVVTRKAPVAGTVQFDAISLATGEYGEAGGVLEDATFKLDLRGGESTFTNPGDLGNALDYSAASPLVGYMGDQRGPQTYTSDFGNLPTQELFAVQNPYYPYTTNTQNVLHFYQDQKTDTTAVLSSVVIPDAAPHGKVQTFYLRFRWDGSVTGKTYDPTYIFQSGNAVNGWSTKGVALYIKKDSGALGVRGSDLMMDFSKISIKVGDWYDAFVTFVQDDSGVGYSATGTICKPSSDGVNFNPPALISQTRTSTDRTLSFDSTNLTLGGYHNSSDGSSITRCFRGLIADFMIWERALTDEEKIEVMAGQHGSKWTIGAANGSADEFTDTDPAAVYEPQTMPWRQMRKILTAASPTLTLKSPLASYEAGKPVILSVTPILIGTGDEVPVKVSVNGAAAGTLDLAKEHSLIIDRQHWTRDENGNVTVAITRTDTTGSVAIDAITLSGSWQITPADGKGNGMLDQKYAPEMAFAGDSNVKHFTSALSVGNSKTNYTFGVWIPEGMGEKCGWKFSTKTTDVSGDNGFTERHALYVNGTAVGKHDGWFAAKETFTLEIPAGKLHDGMNYVQWVQTLPTRAEQQAADGRPGVYQFYDYWGMTLVPPSKGLMIIIR